MDFTCIYKPEAFCTLFHLRSSSWDGGGGSNVGVDREEGYGGVEGERLQDIFCKLFQVRIVENRISKVFVSAVQIYICLF